MREKLRFLGLDVHAETIAVAEPDGEVRSLGTIANREESIRKLIRKHGGPHGQVFVRGVEAGSVASAASADQVPAAHKSASPLLGVKAWTER
jgi:hypothetical protein